MASNQEPGWNQVLKGLSYMCVGLGMILGPYLATALGLRLLPGLLEFGFGLLFFFGSLFGVVMAFYGCWWTTACPRSVRFGRPTAVVAAIAFTLTVALGIRLIVTELQRQEPQSAARLEPLALVGSAGLAFTTMAVFLWRLALHFGRSRQAVETLFFVPLIWVWFYWIVPSGVPMFLFGLMDWLAFAGTAAIHFWFLRLLWQAYSAIDCYVGQPQVR